MENAKKFFEEVIKTEEAKVIINATKNPETEEERIDAYLEIAKKLNVELTAEGILAYFAAEKPASGEIDDEELAQLTGGADHPSCKVNYMHEENCWWDDGCDKIYNGYMYYNCKNLSADHGDKRDNPPIPGTEVWLPI